MTVLSNIITPSNVLTTTNTATVTNKTLTSPTVAGMTVSDGTANGVTYLNGSKVLTSGTGLVFESGSLGVNYSTPSALATFAVKDSGATGTIAVLSSTASNTLYIKNTGTAINFSYNDNYPMTWAINSAEQMRLTSTGLGIGTSSPSYKLQVAGTSGTVGIGITGSHANGDIGLFYNLASAITGSYSTINASISASNGLNTTFANTNSSSGTAHSRLDIQTTGASGGDPKTTYTISGVLNWCTGIDNSDSDKFKISYSDAPGTNDYLTIDTSGRTIFGTAPNNLGVICSKFDGGSVIGISLQKSNTNNMGAMRLYNSSATEVGSIVCTESGTTFATSSDYRLKNTIAPMTGALAKVTQLKPVTYKWNVDGSSSQGFIAHELQEIVPECVLGEKDGVDADGNPVYQGIDTSFLVATLTSALQELNAKFEAYVASHP